MNGAQTAPLSDWITSVWSRLDGKMPYAREKAQGIGFIPYTTQRGEWKPSPTDNLSWWTNGFWGAEMWQMYIATGDEAYRREAEHCEEMLDAPLRDFEGLHHDVGFMWNMTSGVHYRLDGNAESRRRLMVAASVLAGRFNPKGFLRAWNGDHTGWAIIDCMMNLPLLYRASEMLEDPRFANIAMVHADTTLRHFLRPDGSVHHIVVFDPHTGEPVDTPTGQGYAPGSSWSRGQAWALYGFTLSYQHTRKAEYLDAAKRVAHYFIANVQADWLPNCDFRAPAQPVIKDNCAGSIAASGLLELADAVPEHEAPLYRNAAICLLQAMEANNADWTNDDPAIFQQCTAAYHDTPNHHITMTYGDYFFIEAMQKLRGTAKPIFW